MPEPVSKKQIATAIAGWDALRVAAGPHFLTGHSPERAQLVAGLRDLADFLETRLDVPVDKLYASGRIQVYAGGTPEQKRAQVDYAARLMGADTQDRTREGGHYRAALAFGPVTYEMIGVLARRPGPVFATGQEVRLTTGASDHAEKTGMAQAGYVTGCTEDPAGGHDSYTVHFPGLAGDQEGWEPSWIAPVQFTRIDLPSGDTVTSMAAAEKLLIKYVTQAGSAGDAGHADREALAEGLGRACGLEPAELVRQIEAQARGRENSPESPKSAPDLAAGDRPPVTSVVEEVPAQREASTAPGAKPAVRPPQRKGTVT